MSREVQSALKLFRIMYIVYDVYEKQDLGENLRRCRSDLIRRDFIGDLSAEQRGR